MANDWQIRGRSDACAITGRPFTEGEYFYTVLSREKEGFSRQDLSEEAWRDRNDNIRPFSFWRSKFELPPPPEAQPLEKETAEDLLRRFMAESDTQHQNARYILALMLERKRLLKQIEAQESDSGRTLIYQHAKTGEVFVIPDPGLQLDQIESVQNEVAELLQ